MTMVSFESSIVSTGTIKKTHLQVEAPATRSIKVHEIHVSFDGQDPTEPQVDVRVVRQEDVGSGGDAVTGKHMDQNNTDTIDTTGLDDIDGSGGDPTEGDELKREYVHPQGAWSWIAAKGEEIVVKKGEQLGITMEVGTAQNAFSRMIVGE